MSATRVLRSCAALLVVAAGCSGQSEDVEDLTARIEVLEQQVEDLTAGTSSARSLQGVEAPVAEGSAEAEDPTETEPTPVPAATEEGGLVVVVQRTLADATFLGVDDPEFGGTTITGDEREATIRLFRAGLENASLVVDLLLTLGFEQGVLDAVQSVDVSGEAQSADGVYQAMWATTAEELVLELRWP